MSILEMAHEHGGPVLVWIVIVGGLLLFFLDIVIMLAFFARALLRLWMGEKAAGAGNRAGKLHDLGKLYDLRRSD